MNRSTKRNTEAAREMEIFQELNIDNSNGLKNISKAKLKKLDKYSIKKMFDLKAFDGFWPNCIFEVMMSKKFSN